MILHDFMGYKIYACICICHNEIQKVISKSQINGEKVIRSATIAGVKRMG